MSYSMPTPANIELHVISRVAGPQLSQAWQEKGGKPAQFHDTCESLLSALNAAPKAICVIEDTPELDLTDCVSQIAAAAPSVPTIVIGNNLPVSAMRILMGLPCWDLLDAQLSFDMIHKALSRAKDALAVQAASSTSNTAKQCWSFVSSMGGAGASLLAVETAYQLSQRKSKPKVALIDLNFIDGSVSTYLNCEANFKPSVFQKHPAQIDSVFLQTLTTFHPYDIDVLAMPRWSKLETPPSKAVVLQCLNVACEVYDYVVIDSPRWPTEWSKDVYLGSDEVILVTELSVPALNASRQWVEQFLNDPVQPSVRPVLNRLQKGFFGAKVTKEQAESALQTSVFASIRSDWPTALSAVNLGQAVGDVKPGSTIPKDVCALIDLLDQTAKAESPQVTDRRVA